MSEALERATQDITEQDLASMVLVKEDFPDRFREFQRGREGSLDNETMALQGFPGSTTEDIWATGRITGYLREFVTPLQPELLEDRSELITATVVHLFRDRDAVSKWMGEKFLGEFQRSVGKKIGLGQQLIAADRLDYEGFYDEAVGLRTLQTSRAGLVTSYIIDFRVGRLLGVAYLVTLGDGDQHQAVGELGLELERRMVRVVLDAT